jgi:hypothetical protein
VSKGFKVSATSLKLGYRQALRLFAARYRREGIRRQGARVLIDIKNVECIGRPKTDREVEILAGRVYENAAFTAFDERREMVSHCSLVGNFLCKWR